MDVLLGLPVVDGRVNVPEELVADVDLKAVSPFPYLILGVWDVIEDLGPLLDDFRPAFPQPEVWYLWHYNTLNMPKLDRLLLRPQNLLEESFAAVLGAGDVQAG